MVPPETPGTLSAKAIQKPFNICIIISISNRDKYCITALAAGRNIDLLEKQAREFCPKAVAVFDESAAAAVIPAKDSVVLVYCRSGNRSKTASQTLAELGYTQADL